MQSKLFDSELKVMGVLWREVDCTAKHISDVLKQEVGWNMNTTYTVIKRLAERGVVHTENAVVTSRVAREDVQRAESRAFVAHNFHGSLPAFLTAFMGNSKLSKEDADVLHAMIDRFEQENSGRN